MGALKALESRGLSVVARADEPSAKDSTGKLTLLEIVGHDRPGIIREITRVLVNQGVNMEEIIQRMRERSYVGETLFKKARIRLQLPCAMRFRQRFAVNWKNCVRPCGGHFVGGSGRQSHADAPLRADGTIHFLGAKFRCIFELHWRACFGFVGVVGQGLLGAPGF